MTGAFLLLVPLALGALVVRALVGARVGLAVRVPLALGLGAGLASVATFAWLSLAGPTSAGALAVADVVALAVLGATAVALGRDHAAPAPVAARQFSTDERVLAALFAAAALVAAVGLVFHALDVPRGRWDAVMIWTLRPRAILRAGDAWRDAFDARVIHTDYPLALPLTILRGWVALGRESFAVPAAIGGVATLATIALAAGAAAAVRGRWTGRPAGAVVAGTEILTRNGASCCADIPVGFFLLAAVASLHLGGVLPRWRALALAGLSTGLAAWTKNEGLLFLVALSLGVTVEGWRRGGARRAAADAGAFLLGALPLVVTILVFKTTLAPANDLVAGQAQGATWVRLRDPSRWWQIAAAFADEGKTIPLPGLVLVVLLCGLRPGALREDGALATALALALALAGFYAVYLTTPLDLAFHLETSAKRLLVQLWPSFVLFALLVARVPVAETNPQEPVRPANATEVTTP